MSDHSPVFARYEANREGHRRWIAEHYIAEFRLKPGRLLDVGCGNGFWASLFADAGFDVAAFDVNPAYIADGQAKYPTIDFRVADATKRVTKLGRFDVVFIRTIQPFYAPTLDAAEKIVRHALDYLVDGGLLLLSAYSDGKGEDRPMAIGGFARHHTDADFLAMIERAGGTVEKVVRVGHYLQVGVVR